MNVGISGIGDICKTIHCNRPLKYLQRVGVPWLFSLNNLGNSSFPISEEEGGVRNFLIYRLVRCQKLLVPAPSQIPNQIPLQQSNPLWEMIKKMEMLMMAMSGDDDDDDDDNVR